MAADKSFIISCVDDALKMEKSIYILDEIAQKCSAQAKKIDAEVMRKKQETEKSRKRCNSIINEIERIQSETQWKIKHPIKNYLNGWTKDFNFKDLLGSIFIFYMIGIALMGVVYIFAQIIHLEKLNRFLDKLTSADSIIISMGSPALLGLIIVILLFIYGLIHSIKSTKRIESDESFKKTKELEDECTTLNNKISAVAIQAMTQIDKASVLYAQAQTCRQKSDEIKEVLQKFYTHTNVIPVDYRSLDHVMIFSHVFRNDLADTMREAVIYYETCVFRDKVIRGINNIIAKIDQLIFAVQGIKDEIYYLNNTVSSLCQEFNTTNKLKAESIEETRATRYAIESLDYSIKTYNYYRSH